VSLESRALSSVIWRKGPGHNLRGQGGYGSHGSGSQCLLKLIIGYVHIHYCRERLLLFFPTILLSLLFVGRRMALAWFALLVYIDDYYKYVCELLNGFGPFGEDVHTTIK